MGVIDNRKVMDKVCTPSPVSSPIKGEEDKVNFPFRGEGNNEG